MDQYSDKSKSFGGLDCNYTSWSMNIAPCLKWNSLPGTVAAGWLKWLMCSMTKWKKIVEVWNMTIYMPALVSNQPGVILHKAPQWH